MGENNVKDVLSEILERIENEVFEKLDSGGDDWFTAQCISDVKEIIEEYL